MVGLCLVVWWAGANGRCVGVSLLIVGCCGLRVDENIVGFRYVQGVCKEAECGDCGRRGCGEW